MPKCIICQAEGKYQIKGTQNYYCEPCAKDMFSDISYLNKIEEGAKALKAKIDKIIKENKKEE